MTRSPRPRKPRSVRVPSDDSPNGPGGAAASPAPATTPTAQGTEPLEVPAERDSLARWPGARPLEIPTEPLQRTGPENVLSEYAGDDGLVVVLVRVSHDAVFEGQTVRVPVTRRTAGLVERGFLEPVQELVGHWPSETE